MARRRALERAILAILIAGAVAFCLLLAGIGSGLLTKSPH
jgi:hypothetical protein